MKQVDLDRLFAKANDYAEDLADDIHPDNTPGRIKRKSRDAFEDFAQWVFEFIDDLQPEVEDEKIPEEPELVEVEVWFHSRVGSELEERVFFDTLDEANDWIDRFNNREKPPKNINGFNRQWFYEAKLKPVAQLPLGGVSL